MHDRSLSMQRILIVLVILFSLLSQAQSADRIRIGVFWENRPSKMAVSGNVQSYDVIADGAVVDQLSPADLFYLTYSGDRVQLKTLSHLVGTYSKVVFRPKLPGASLTLDPIKPNDILRNYEGTFEITTARGRLKIINDVPFDLYLGGVVQSEAGNRHTLEYYKVQAIICRTYALKHFFKFKREGFNLCDRVDSQVYKTMAWNDTIREAVKATHDVVIVDSDINLISAVFHSNSGGNTINSEDLWVQEVPYLRAVKDTFSVCQPHYDWTVAVHKDTYLGYFAKAYGIDTADSAMQQAILNYCPAERHPYYFPRVSQVPLRKMRTDFKLRSTSFCTGMSADSVILVGRGFGHGVGLSQEGAMLMAKLGYNYTQILHHYYQNIHLIKLSVIDFFREED